MVAVSTLKLCQAPAVAVEKQLCCVRVTTGLWQSGCAYVFRRVWVPLGGEAPGALLMLTGRHTPEESAKSDKDSGRNSLLQKYVL